MDPFKKRILEKNLPAFVDEVDPQQLLPFLKCLNNYSKEEIEAYQTNRGRFHGANKLYEHLIRKPRGFDELVAALRNPSVNMTELADKLDPPESLSPPRASPNFSVSLRLPSAHVDPPHRSISAPDGVLLYTRSEAAPQVTCAGSTVPPASAQRKYELTTPWKQLTARVKIEIKKFDIGNALKTPDDLAGVLDFTNEKVDEIKQKVQKGESLTLAFIEHWNETNPITLKDILWVFHELERLDIVRKLEEITKVKYDNNEHVLDGAPGGDGAAGIRLDVEQSGIENRGDNPRPDIGASHVNNGVYPNASRLGAGRYEERANIPSRDVHVPTVHLPEPRWEDTLHNTNKSNPSKPGSNGAKVMLGLIYETKEEKKTNDDTDTQSYKHHVKVFEASNRKGINSDTKDLFMDESSSLEIDCPKPEKFVGYKRMEILGKRDSYENPELRPTQEPLHENIFMSSQNLIENSSPVRGETERVMNITNDDMSNDSNCSSNTDNCSQNNLQNPDDSDLGKKFSSVELKKENNVRRFEERLEMTQNISDILKQDDMSIAHMSIDSDLGKKFSSVELKKENNVRRFEERLEMTQNISDILKQDDMCIAHMSIDSGACANVDKGAQLCATRETQFEDYSMEVPPKIPSFTNEFNSIDRKADKPLPFLLDTTSVHNTGEFDANSQEGNNMCAEGMLSVESQNSDASHLTSDRPPDTGVKDYLHCKIDFQNRGGNTYFPRESTLLERTRNVHNLDGGIKNEESGNLTDQSVFPEQINDNALGDSGFDCAGNDGAQQGACGKENKGGYSGMVDTLKNMSLGQVVVKAVEFYNSLI